MKRFVAAMVLAGSAMLAGAQAPVKDADLLAPLDFLVGTWAAKTNAAGSSGGESAGTYTFRRDLGGHALERTGSADSCKGPKGFDCDHHDRLTVFVDPNGLGSEHHSALFAFYLDNEGHVIYYTVAMPDAHTAVFSSQGSPTQPKYRLTYHLEGSGSTAVMSGKFQFAPPGSSDYTSYLEWSGPRR